MPNPVWLFDLDNTLHHASRHAFPVIDAAMTSFLMRELQLDHASANHLRVHYWQRYGATLLGLRRHHPHIDPRHFLAVCHPLDELLREVHPMPGLHRTLARLPGRKILFTNGPLSYARAMLDALRISHEFDGIAAIDTLGLIPKPFPQAYRRVLRHFGLRAAQCTLVEDSTDNLLTAKRLGMRTVWLSRLRRNHPAADLHLRQLAELPLRLR
ncbi:pyrimidine 5'-nucleotidase [Chitinilyticum piscinae]|uniref:Pyrimidine 5'-nucleotidase n=1 Tax=Chitinilyticum piscinae TaxID=2866724 RepID=A0A8J7K2K5_9NEIS|nr:pyrimidine 5'-nucleotidase [Chitinilyticum piscinae]MBE9610586.1 pyrimidine 5'-nucleotidase [Chitinilyticum piscinae]